jgi:acyl-CoA thioesterase II
MDGDGIENLVETLALEKIEENLYRGRTSPRDTQRIYGGHVIAQALLAAYATIDGRICHSLHCYFIRPGDPSIPVLYQVDRARDGTSFTTRRVTAIQHGRQIFNSAASFQIPEQGFEHQTAAPEAPDPDSLPDIVESWRTIAATLPDAEAEALLRPRPIEQRLADPRGFGEKAPPYSRTWMRAKAPIGPDPHLHQVILAYSTDMGLMEASMRPHGLTWRQPGFQAASLDHAIWFHRPSNFNHWHLFEQESPSASGGRGMNRGQIFSEDGVLVASTAQEALIRQR